MVTLHKTKIPLTIQKRNTLNNGYYAMERVASQCEFPREI